MWITYYPTIQQTTFNVLRRKTSIFRKALNSQVIDRLGQIKKGRNACGMISSVNDSLD